MHSFNAFVYLFHYSCHFWICLYWLFLSPYLWSWFHALHIWKFFFLILLRVRFFFSIFLRGNPLNIFETCCFQPSYLETMWWCFFSCFYLFFRKDYSSLNVGLIWSHFWGCIFLPVSPATTNWLLGRWIIPSSVWDLWIVLSIPFQWFFS